MSVLMPPSPCSTSRLQVVRPQNFLDVSAEPQLWWGARARGALGGLSASGDCYYSDSGAPRSPLFDRDVVSTPTFCRVHWGLLAEPNEPYGSNLLGDLRQVVVLLSVLEPSLVK